MTTLVTSGVLLVLLAASSPSTGDEQAGKSSALPTEAVPLQTEGFPERPKPLIELGEPFLGTGTLDKGLKLPTGAVWQPSLLAFGTFRTALQTFDGGARTSEWANRLDLFFNLQLSGTERLVVGFRSLDRSGRFSGYVFESPDPALDGESREEFNAEVETLFFEGDFGEIFPNLDREDKRSLDFGFSVGRQPLLFQEGILINDSIDAIGITRNTLMPRGTSNFRLTLLYGWGDLHRGGPGVNPEDRTAELLAVLTSTDFRRSTVDLDVAWVRSDDPRSGDLLTGGISAVQRIGALNTAFRVLGSIASDRETAFATDGLLLFNELSWTPHYTHDLAYVNTFLAVDEFSSAARGPATGGPLGRAGINFAAVGLGSFGAPLSNRARDVIGGAVGYQKFFDHTRKQVIFELGARVGIDDAEADSAAFTARYQSAMGRRFVLVVDGFLGYRQGLTGVLGAADDEAIYGGRLELVVKF